VYLNLNTPVSVVASGGGGTVPSNLVVSTLSAFGLTNISSINGTAYTGAGAVPANLVISTISTAGGASFAGQVYAPNRVNLGSTFIQSGGGTLVNLVIDVPYGNLRLLGASTTMTGPGTSTCLVTMDGNLNVSSINGAAVGAAAVPANLVVSTLTAPDGIFPGVGQAANGPVVVSQNVSTLAMAAGSSGNVILAAGGAGCTTTIAGVSTLIQGSVGGAACQLVVNGNMGISSINGTSWTYITSTLLGLSP
jgi:hypothetical protein